jgi:hypothetical protein
VGLPAATVRGGKVAEAARESQRRGQRDLLESTTSVAWPLSKVAGQGQEPGSCDGGSRTRVAGFYLGHRDPSRNSVQGTSTAYGLK